MTPALASILAAATVLASRDAGHRRLRRPSGRRIGPRRALLAGVAPAAAGTLLLGLPAVVACLTVAGLAVVVRLRRRAKPVSASDLALALDVLAGCLAAGAAMPSALAAARAVAPARLSDAFAAAAFALERGEAPDATWGRVGAALPELEDVGRLCARAAATGAPVAAELHRIAASHRTALSARRRRRLEQASVWLVLPLGLCFLPAFVLVGVVPLVIGAFPRAL